MKLPSWISTRSARKDPSLTGSSGVVGDRSRDGEHPAGGTAGDRLVPGVVAEIVHGTRQITADTARRLARYLVTSDDLWLDLQSHYDVDIERERLADTLDQISPLPS